jgi:hypothetical protein
MRTQERVGVMNGWRNLILVVAVGACMTADAGWFGFGKRRVDTLVITGNFAKSRLLAELFQHKTKQPIVLISPEGIGRDQLFFMPTVPEAMAFDATKYVEFIDFLHPGRIVFIGDASFVPPSYIDQVRGRYPTVVLNSRDWLDNAKALGGIIKDRGLAKRYGSYFEKLDAAAGSIPASSDRYAEPALPEPLAMPQLMAPVQQ